jgi:hypothetical protein
MRTPTSSSCWSETRVICGGLFGIRLSNMIQSYCRLLSTCLNRVSTCLNRAAVVSTSFQLPILHSIACMQQQ